MMLTQAQGNNPNQNQGFNNANNNNQSPYGQMTNDQIFNKQQFSYNNTKPIQNDIRRSFLNDQYAVDSNRLISKKGSNHVRSLIASFILVVGLSTVLGLYFGGIFEIEMGGLIGICVGIYLFYLILGLCANPLLAYLKNIQHGANFQTSYNKIRSICGYFSFHVVCYHYETRFHTRTVRDSNGNTRTQTYTTQQKVITHTATQQLNPRQCKDESGNADQIMASTQVVFVHNKVNYRFKDEHSRRQFQYAWSSFRSRHRRDAHQDYSQNFILPGLVARLTFYVGQQPKNYLCYLVFCSIFGCIWPYSMYVESKVSRFDVQYMKVVGL